MEDKRNSSHKKFKQQLILEGRDKSKKTYCFTSAKNQSYLNNLINKYQVESFTDLKTLLAKKNRNFKQLLEHPTEVNELKSNFLKSGNFIEYVQGLFKINFIKKFNTVHVFIHEKGKSIATHLEVTKYDLRSYERSVPDFNNLFNAIKKSKNRSFGQSGLKGLNFKILGTFIGREFYLPKHNVIFLLSRDEFLPQDQSDIETFNLISQLLPGQINSLLSLDANNKQINNIQTVLTNMNLPIKVIKDEEVIFNTIHDINEEKQIEKILNIGDMAVEVSRKTAFKIDKADIYHKERIALLGELLNTLKHELSNPLFGLKLTSELLLMEEITIEQKEFLTEISKSLDRCSNIIENFSNLYHSINEFTTVDIPVLIDEVIKLTKSVTRGIQKEINVAGPSLDPIISNPTWIVQILFNLIINSAQELNKLNLNKPIIGIRIKADTDYIYIQVSDNGQGINTYNKNTIFSPFYTTKDRGTGLGLYISRALAKKLSGTLEYIQNSDSSGAIFELKLPRRATHDESANN